MPITNPIIYEINTQVWLADLGRCLGRPVNLESLPDSCWDAIADLHVDVIWFMGLWERSPGGRKIASCHPDLQAEYRQALADLSPGDVVGSPYAIHRYAVADHLGGRTGLATARRKLAERGLGLYVDFVPNHLAVDHRWVVTRPHLFIRAEEQDTVQEGFFRAANDVFAHGRDPYFPAWTDTVQVNAFAPEYRQLAITVLRDLADQSDGVRCDMAMLLVNGIFAGTWGKLAGPRPSAEFWPEVIGAVHETHPDFRFLAEVYWNMEVEMVKQGFDYVYDKGLYDRLCAADIGMINEHLRHTCDSAVGWVRFIENHDEPRANTVFEPSVHRAVAVVAATVPGALLLHEGQLDGRRVKIPVQLGRRPFEESDRALRSFYQELLLVASRPAFQTGSCVVCDCHGWPDNQTCQSLVAFTRETSGERYAVVANLATQPSQGRILLPWTDLAGKSWRFKDLLTTEEFNRDGTELATEGLFVDLPPWGFHLLMVQ